MHKVSDARLCSVGELGAGEVRERASRGLGLAGCVGVLWIVEEKRRQPHQGKINWGERNLEKLLRPIPRSLDYFWFVN